MVRVPVIVLILLCALVSPLSAQTARLIVFVDDDSGEPIRDARIQLFRPTPRSEQPTLVGTFVTDALGVVEISVDAFRPYELRVTHEQFKASELHSDHEFIWPFEGDVEIRFRLSGNIDLIQYDVDDVPRPTVAKGSLVGQVISPTGEALPNMPIVAHGDGGRIAHTRTDDGGSYSFALEPDTYRIGAGGELVAPPSMRSSPVYTAYARNEQTRARVTSGRRTRADIVLSAVRLFNVTVMVNDDQGQAVPNARIFGVAKRENLSVNGSAQTGQDGSAMIGPTPPGPVELLVHATKDGRHFIGSATVDIQNSPLNVTMTLVPSGIITGRVEFLGRAAPLHGPGGLHVIHNSAGKTRRPHTNLDPSGRVSATGDFMVMHLLGAECLWLINIPPEWRLLDITHDGQDYTRRPFLLESGQTISDVVIRVEPRVAESTTPPACSP